MEELQLLFPGEAGLAAWALRWILMFDEVSCVIPGASKLWHVESNVAAGALPPLSDEQMAGVREVYETYIKPQVHHLW